MTPFKLILIFFISIFVSPPAWAEEMESWAENLKKMENWDGNNETFHLKKDTVYYCTGSNANGFIYNKKSKTYERTGFQKEKYVVKMKKNLGSIRIGDNNFTCFVPYIGVNNNAIVCNSLTQHFHFSSKTGNFIYFKGYGYLNIYHDREELNDPVWSEIGKCVKFD